MVGQKATIKTINVTLFLKILNQIGDLDYWNHPDPSPSAELFDPKPTDFHN